MVVAVGTRERPGLDLRIYPARCWRSGSRKAPAHHDAVVESDERGDGTSRDAAFGSLHRRKQWKTTELKAQGGGLAGMCASLMVPLILANSSEWHHTTREGVIVGIPQTHNPRRKAGNGESFVKRSNVMRVLGVARRGPPSAKTSCEFGQHRQRLCPR